MKREFNILTLGLLVSLLMLSCKKEHVTTNTNSSPVFYFKGMIGGTAMDLQAGINNYYMYSSYTQDSNGVYNYTGNLKEYNCSSTCPPSIEFIINDYRKVSLGAIENNINQALANGYFNYMVPGGTPTSFSMAFNPTQGPSDTIVSYTWNFGDSTSTTTTSSVMNSIVHTYPHTGSYTPFLSVLFSDGTTNSLGSVIQMGNPSVSLNSSFTVSHDTSFISSVSGGSGIYLYSWNFGDISSGLNNTSTAKNPNHTFTNDSIHKVVLLVTDSLSKKTVTAVAYASGNPSTQKHIFSYSYAPIIIPNNMGLSNIRVIYTDATGDQYTSNNPAQSDSSYFQITSVSNYQANENSQSTKQLHITFNCTVYDLSGNKLAIKNGDAVIAVAYK